MKAGTQFRIGELADVTGVNLETVRYYERIGVMPEPGRTASGHRAYTEAHRDRLVFIRRARELGFSLDTVRRLIALSDPSENTCAQVRSLASEHLEEVRRKLADLVRLEAALDHLVRKCDQNTFDECPVVMALTRPE
jgi:MerR family mercuric resistance operon transcriptional regulator